MSFPSLLPLAAKEEMIDFGKFHIVRGWNTCCNVCNSRVLLLCSGTPTTGVGFYMCPNCDHIAKLGKDGGIIRQGKWDQPPIPYGDKDDHEKELDEFLDDLADRRAEADRVWIDVLPEIPEGYTEDPEGTHSYRSCSRPEHMSMYFCPCCKGWILGHPISRVPNTGRDHSRSDTRQGLVFECSNCETEVGFYHSDQVKTIG